jgi:hypothetical protein
LTTSTTRQVDFTVVPHRKVLRMSILELSRRFRLPRHSGIDTFLSFRKRLMKHGFITVPMQTSLMMRKRLLMRRMKKLV